MNLEELISRADAMRAHYRLLESVKGSGYHDEDRNLARPEQFQAPQKNGLPKTSESVVAFFDHFDEEEVHFVGQDAARVREALQIWFEQSKSSDVVNLPGTNRKLILRIIPKMLNANPNMLGNSHVCFRLCDWNDVLFALLESKLSILGSPLVLDGTAR